MMRNCQKQRALRQAGIRREERIGPRNGEQYIDPTPQEAMKRIVKGGKRQ